MFNSNLLKWFIKRRRVLLSALVLTIIVFQLSETNFTPLTERVIYFILILGCFLRKVLTK